MSGKPESVFQFKITLKNINPPIWRRVLVPAKYTFWDFHVAIQDSMGWLDCHLHEFTVLNRATGNRERIGIPEGSYDLEVAAGWQKQIRDYFSDENPKAAYDYDFGDGWQHDIIFEKLISLVVNEEIPQCVAGERACPPEDCGGPWGYDELLNILKDPKHEEHQSMLQWAGGKFDPEDFDPQRVKFDNPKKRWEYAFGGR